METVSYTVGMVSYHVGACELRVVCSHCCGSVIARSDVVKVCYRPQL